MSLLTVISGLERVVVAADSRAVQPGGTPSDQSYKLVNAGTNTVCGISGATNIPNDSDTEFIFISEIVDGVCRQVHLRDSPAALLEAICDEFEPIFRRQKELSETDALLFGAFAIQKHPDGKITFVSAEFPLVTDETGKRYLGETVIRKHIDCGTPGKFFYSLGHGDCLTEALQKSVDPDALNDAALLSGVHGILDAAAVSPNAHGEIGGPIDVAVIDSNGVRWLRKKPQSLRGLVTPKWLKQVNTGIAATTCIAVIASFAFGGAALGIGSLVGGTVVLALPWLRRKWANRNPRFVHDSR